MIKYAYYNFKYGILKIGYKEQSVVYLKRADKIDKKNEPSALSDNAYKQVCEYLEGRRVIFDFPYQLEGTEFQKKVWDALLQIPYGTICTYKQVAEAIGSPRGSRAVGLANNKNPINIVVPCHRVIGTNGRLVGYAGGLAMKEALLQLEKRPVIN